MTKVDEYAPTVEKLIEYTSINACESGDSEWAHKLERAYRKDDDTLDYAFIDVFRAWAAKHNL